jgi:hypothetical protein
MPDTPPLKYMAYCASSLSSSLCALLKRIKAIKSITISKVQAPTNIYLALVSIYAPDFPFPLLRLCEHGFASLPLMYENNPVPAEMQEFAIILKNYHLKLQSNMLFHRQATISSEKRRAQAVPS